MPLDQAIEFITRIEGDHEKVVALRINGQDRLEMPYEAPIEIRHVGGIPSTVVTVTLLATSIRYTPDE